MTAKTRNKSATYKLPPTADQRRIHRVAGIVVPADENRRLVAAAAYFRAARHRHVGAEGCRRNDECAAASELEAVLRRHSISEDAGFADGGE